jgi:hypothetical protein
VYIRAFDIPEARDEEDEEADFSEIFWPPISIDTAPFLLAVTDTDFHSSWVSHDSTVTLAACALFFAEEGLGLRCLLTKQPA